MKISSAFGIILLGVWPALAGPAIEHHPLSIGAFQEFGAIRKGVLGGPVLKEVQSEWIDHFGAFITQSITVDDRFHVTGGLGGIFQFRKPEIVNGGFAGSQRKAFFIGPTVAEAVYDFGDPDSPFLRLGIGMFPYKYNGDASNLGEYLFRTGVYPNVITTGGYAIANSTAAYLQGVKANLKYGNFRLDLMLITETALAPLYDGSVAGVGTYIAGDGLLEIGAGVNFKRLLPVYPKRTTRENKANGYFYSNGRAMSSNYNYYASSKNFWQTKLQTAVTPQDSARFTRLMGLNDSLANIVDGLDKLPEAERPRISYYTASGTILMARASLDVKNLTGTGPLGPSDLRIFAEAALLGWKNYPVFYTDRMRRIPVMAGINLPAFKLLDLLSVQLEYFNSPYLNSTWPIGSDGNNIPFVPEPSDKIVSQDEFYDIAGKDNLKWSVLASKRLHANVALKAQFASDHLRITDASFYYGPQLNPNEVTLRKRDWYWMLQLAWGI